MGSMRTLLTATLGGIEIMSSRRSIETNRLIGSCWSNLLAICFPQRMKLSDMSN